MDHAIGGTPAETVLYGALELSDEGECKKTEAAFVRLIASLRFRALCDFNELCVAEIAHSATLAR
jgi:hypothetical protein